MAIEFVPPVMEAMNCCSVTTFTETLAGEIVTLMFVTGSVQVEVDVVLEEVDVFVVQVTAVLAGAAPHELRPSAAARAKASTSREERSAPNGKERL